MAPAIWPWYHSQSTAQSTHICLLFSPKYQSTSRVSTLGKMGVPKSHSGYWRSCGRCLASSYLGLEDHPAGRTESPRRDQAMPPVDRSTLDHRPSTSQSLRGKLSLHLLIDPLPQVGKVIEPPESRDDVDVRVIDLCPVLLALDERANLS